MTEASKTDEFAIIARHFAPLAAAQPSAFGLTDDAAVVHVGSGQSVVVTTDTLIVGVHFLPIDPPESVAAKLLSVNLSDLAAMGSRPFAYTLSVALPSSWGSDELDQWLAAFARGLAERQTEVGIALIGGDTVATPGPLCLTITALGTVATGCELRRSTARPGDAVYVSGTIGDAALGLRALTGELSGLPNEHWKALVERYRVPSARTALGQSLVGLAHAVIDISDGLVADLNHICTASDVSATLETARVPLSAAARTVVALHPELMLSVLTGGDDYELLFTAPPEANPVVEAVSRELNLPLSVVGRIGAPLGADQSLAVRLVGHEQSAITAGGYRHF